MTREPHEKSRALARLERIDDDLVTSDRALRRAKGKLYSAYATALFAAFVLCVYVGVIVVVAATEPELLSAFFEIIGMAGFVVALLVKEGYTGARDASAAGMEKAKRIERLESERVEHMRELEVLEGGLSLTEDADTSGGLTLGSHGGELSSSTPRRK